jgi:hypothetical protein
MAIWDDYNWKFWKPNDEPLPEKAKRFRKISICTTCMDRTHDLKKTLIQNILDNSDYPNVEFVVLNYNSKDDMHEWVQGELRLWIKNGVVSYHRTKTPKFYDMAKSRNLAFSLAQGEICNNVDADNYTGKGFASVINKMAELCPDHAVFSKGKRLMHGRLGFYKDEFFEELGGYDEELVGYGFDDHNIMYRAMNNGYKMMWWGDVCPMSRIKTPRGIVGKNMVNKKWKETEKINKKITMDKIKKGIMKVNGN